MIKKLLPLCTIFIAAALAISAADAPRVTRNLITTAEKALDERILRMWSDNYMAIVGPTRGVYLPGFGIVFTAEMNLATANVSLMSPTLTEADKVTLHKKKLERLPQLKTELRKVLADMAASLDPVPATEQVVVAVILPRFTWESPTGLPLQMVAQATKQQLLTARGNAAALEQIVKISESN